MNEEIQIKMTRYNEPRILAILHSDITRFLPLSK
jgi:hypothetical protein